MLTTMTVTAHAQPTPRPRPAIETPVDAPEPADERSADEDTVGPAALPHARSETSDDPADPATLLEIRELEACEAALDAFGVEYSRIDDIASTDDGCGVRHPVSVSAFSSGVAVTPAARMTCETALAAAKWIAGVVRPAAEALEVELVRVVQGSTYVCRRRNNQPTGKLSEHARGKALDVMAFEFEGRPAIPVEPRAGNGTIEEAFQRAVRAGACLHFTTVLGPGSDEFHADHLHLDLALRTNRYRLCQ